MSDADFAGYATIAHEALFKHRASALFLELHWRLTDKRARPILGDGELFAYLCLHGARHGWARLKWLADVAAWLAARYRTRSKLSIEAPRHWAAIARPASPDAVRSPFWVGGAAIRARAGLAYAMASPDCHERHASSREPYANSLTIELAQFLVADTMREGLDQLKRRMVGWRDFQTLPRSLSFVYLLLRLPSWFWRPGIRRFR